MGINRKKSKLFISLASMTLASLSFASITSISTTNIHRLNSKNQEATVSQTAIAPNTKTNWMDQSSWIPGSYGEGNLTPLANHNGNQSFVEDFGYLAAPQDGTSMFMMSYSGVVIWSQLFKNNNFLNNFYNEKGMTITNIALQSWVYDSKNEVIVFLLGDRNTYTNQCVMALDAKTGRLYNPKLDNELNVTKVPIIQITDNTKKYNKISILSNGNFVVYSDIENGYNQQVATFSYDKQNGGLTDPSYKSTSNMLGNTGTNNYTLINIIAGANNINFGIFKDNNPIEPNNGTYNQYVSVLNNDLTVVANKTITLSSKFISGNHPTDFSSFSYLDNSNNGTQNVYVLTGGKTNRMLTSFSYTNSNSNLTENTNKNVDLSFYDINTISVNKKNKTIYIGSSHSQDLSYVGKIDLKSNNPEYQSILGDANQKTYYVFPMLENINNDNVERIMVYENSSHAMKCFYKDGSSYSYTSNLSIYKWNRDLFTNIKSANIVRDYMPDRVGLDQIRNFLTFDNSALSPTFEYRRKSWNNEHGTLEFDVIVKYNSFFNSSVRSSFTIPVTLNGFYKINNENVNIQWVTSSDVDNNKYQNITQLKEAKFAKDVTQKEVFDNFWIGSIKDKNGANFPIQQSYFSLRGNYGNYDKLDVTLSLPSNSFPAGFPNLVFRQTFSGFKSIEGYNTTAKSNIPSLVSKMYPSELTKKYVIDNLLTVGTHIKKEEQFWDIQITNIDDFLGTLTLSIRYDYQLAGNIPNPEQFPVSQFNVMTNKTITGFKKINGSLTSKPTISDFDSDYLPSELWNQYLAFKNGNVKESYLYNNLSFDLADKSALELIATNEQSTDADGYIQLEAKIIYGTALDVEYNGKQYVTRDNKLVFNEQLENKLKQEQPSYYPFNMTWNITTRNKFFVINGPDGKPLVQENNTYVINLEDFENVNNSISPNMYAKDFLETEISNLIDTSGYNYFISSYNVDNDKGIVEAILKLELTSPPLVPNFKKQSLKTDDSTQLGNFGRKLIIYNFKLPIPSYFQTFNYVIYGVLASIGLITVLISSIWITRKVRYNSLSVDKELIKENQKKLDQARKKALITERIKNSKRK